MQSSYALSPFQWFILRYQSFFVLVMGFAGAFLLGLLLLNLTAGPAAEASPPPDAAVQKAAAAPELAGGGAIPAAPEVEAPVAPVTLSAVFTPEVRRWEPQIMAWAAEFGLDPNLVATVMQIESCGNPQAVSSVGARGLFQVMPFHFAEGEDMLDPDTNARRGLAYLAQSLALTQGHVGMALAGYNGGHVAAQGSWESWPLEVRRYYRWGSGIYNDAITGLGDSPTLHDWLTAGGDSLCRQAAGHQGP
jgi:soluble lytic murein transglycosylase-like protein